MSFRNRDSATRSSLQISAVAFATFLNRFASGAYSVRRRAHWRNLGILNDTRLRAELHAAGEGATPTWPALRALRRRWAELLRRIFEVDPLRCPRCGKQVRIVAFMTPHSRLVWTNDEGGDGGAVTTATFEEKAGKTLLVMHDLYPSKEALDAAIASGSTGGLSESIRMNTTLGCEARDDRP